MAKMTREQFVEAWAKTILNRDAAKLLADAMGLESEQPPSNRELQVGDRVRVNRHGGGWHNEVGKIDEVNAERMFPYWVVLDIRGSGVWFSAEELQRLPVEPPVTDGLEAAKAETEERARDAAQEEVTACLRRLVDALTASRNELRAERDRFCGLYERATAHVQEMAVERTGLRDEIAEARANLQAVDVALAAAFSEARGGPHTGADGVRLLASVRDWYRHNLCEQVDRTKASAIRARSEGVPADGPGSHRADLAEAHAQRDRADKAEARADKFHRRAQRLEGIEASVQRLRDGHERLVKRLEAERQELRDKLAQTERDAADGSFLTRERERADRAGKEVVHARDQRDVMLKKAVLAEARAEDAQRRAIDAERERQSITARADKAERERDEAQAEAASHEAQAFANAGMVDELVAKVASLSDLLADVTRKLRDADRSFAF